MNWIRYGPRAVLLRNGAARDRSQLGSLFTYLEAGDQRIADWVPAFDQVLVEVHEGVALEDVAVELCAVATNRSGEARRQARHHRIPVQYTGPDLSDALTRLDLTLDEFVAIHSAPVYEVAMLGFSPGFPYLSGLDPRLHLPRRPDPRPRIPAGSVAIGGSHAGIYSVESPGGWHLIGSTEAKLFDPDGGSASACFLLCPGDLVTFFPETAR